MFVADSPSCGRRSHSHIFKHFRFKRNKKKIKFFSFKRFPFFIAFFSSSWQNIYILVGFCWPLASLVALLASGVDFSTPVVE